MQVNQADFYASSAWDFLPTLLRLTAGYRLDLLPNPHA
jgi:hypothetical protein